MYTLNLCGMMHKLTFSSFRCGKLPKGGILPLSESPEVDLINICFSTLHLLFHMPFTLDPSSVICGVDRRASTGPARLDR